MSEFNFNPQEFKVVSLRECPLPEQMHLCDQPDLAALYWRRHVTRHPVFNPQVECLVTLFLNTRRKIIGHVLVSTGTLDTCMVHPREVFRPAIVAASSAIILMHNHPSEADIRATRELLRAGELLKIELLDHVIIGAGNTHSSLKTIGYFY